MNLSRPDQPDATFLRDGGIGFVGVNEREHPTLLPPGYLAAGQNIRCTDGVAEPRLGISILPFGPTYGKTAFTDCYPQGMIEWRNPYDGLKWIIVAANGKVYKTLENRIAEEVTLPAGVTLTADTFKMFVACKDRLVLLRGETEDPLICEDLSVGFTTVALSPTGDGTEPLPRSSFGIFFANRLIVIYDYDKVAVSDDGDVTRYTRFLQAFQINEGDNDELVSIAKLNENNLIFLKRNSVWRVTNIGGDISAAVGPLVVTEQYGCSAPHSVVRVGTDLWWWSDAGLVGLRLTDENETLGQEIRLTDDMAGTMRRINAAWQHRITAAYHDGLVYIAVPLDDAKVLGENLVPDGNTYGPGSVADSRGVTYYIDTITGLTTGNRYQYTELAQIDAGVSHNSTFYLGSNEIELVSTSLTMLGHSQGTVTATLKEVLFTGALNAVMVYDTRRQAWAGVDESAATRVLSFVRHELWGKEELTFLSTDGWWRQYNVGYEDEVEQDQTPYIDILPLAYLDCQGIAAMVVNSGSSVVGSSSSTNSGLQWGCGPDLAGTIANLWRDSADKGGYDQTATSPWTAPNTTPSEIPGGVRFLSTNGSLPTITVDADTLTESGFYGPNDCLYADVHGTTEIGRVPIVTSLTTRAYQQGDIDRKRYSELVAQLQTWAPSYTLKSVMSGAYRSAAHHTDRTLDRTKYFTAGKADYDASNTNEDHATQGRQDYSMELPGTGVKLGTAGINFELHQAVTARVPVDRSSHWCQLELSNTQGRVVLRAVGTDATPGDRTAGLKGT